MSKVDDAEEYKEKLLDITTLAVLVCSTHIICTFWIQDDVL